MISDEEAAKIRRKLDEGWRGPVLLTWLRRLLDDRAKWAKWRTEPGPRWVNQPMRTEASGRDNHGIVAVRSWR